MLEQRYLTPYNCVPEDKAVRLSVLKELAQFNKDVHALAKERGITLAYDVSHYAFSDEALFASKESSAGTVFYSMCNEEDIEYEDIENV